MNKQDIRSVMTALSKQDLTEGQVLTFIKDFAQSQCFKSPTKYRHFCINCGIFFTYSIFTVGNYVKRGLSDEEIEEQRVWFLEECECLADNL